MIELRGFGKDYGEFTAVDSLDLTIAEGEMFGFIGPNGAGKSTALKILAGLLAPSSGSVIIDGVDVEKDPGALASRIGYLPETPPLYEDMTVTNFLVHCGRLKGMTVSAAQARLPDVFEKCALKGHENQVIGTLSHGYRKRVGIAQAIIHNPRFVILDEPISGLDPAQIVDMRSVIRGLGQGRAVMISSHILSEISQTCDRILVVDGGKLVAQGTEAELASRAAPVARLHVTVRGEPAAFMAFLEGHSGCTQATSRTATDGLASATISIEDAQHETLLADILGAGFGLRLVEHPEDELEDIFLALTQEGSA